MAALTRSQLRTRAYDRADRDRAKQTKRSKAYRAVDLRDRLLCRFPPCQRRLVKTIEIRLDRLEHHHIRGRIGKDAETTGNICLLCKEHHDERHVTRVLHVSGDANGVLSFEKDGQIWTSSA